MQEKGYKTTTSAQSFLAIAGKILPPNLIRLMLPSPEWVPSTCRRKFYDQARPTATSPSASYSRFRRPRWSSSRPRRWRAPHRALPAKSPTTAAGLAFPAGWHNLRVAANVSGENEEAKNVCVRPKLQLHLVEGFIVMIDCRRAGSEIRSLQNSPPTKYVWTRTCKGLCG